MTAEQHLRLGVVGVHVLDDPGRRRGERIGLGLGVLGSVDPAHPAVAADVADALHVEAVEGEVAEVDVVRRGRVGLEVAVACGEAVVVGHGRQQAEQRDPPAGERVGAVGYRLGDEQAGPRVAHRVLGVLGHEADEEQRIAAVVEAVAGDRAVRVALRIGGKRGERPPARRGDERAATLGVRRLRRWCPPRSRTRRDAALVADWDLVPSGSFGHGAKLGVVEGLASEQVSLNA